MALDMAEMREKERAMKQKMENMAVEMAEMRQKEKEEKELDKKIDQIVAECEVERRRAEKSEVELAELKELQGTVKKAIGGQLERL